MNLSTIDSADLQQVYAYSEVQTWKEKFRAMKEHCIWVVDTRKLLLPKDFYTYLCQAIHKKGHFGIQAVVDSIKRQWIAPRISTVSKKIYDSCYVCQNFN